MAAAAVYRHIGPWRGSYLVTDELVLDAALLEVLAAARVLSRRTLGLLFGCNEPHGWASVPGRTGTAAGRWSGGVVEQQGVSMVRQQVPEIAVRKEKKVKQLKYFTGKCYLQP